MTHTAGVLALFLPIFSCAIVHPLHNSYMVVYNSTSLYSAIQSSYDYSSRRYRDAKLSSKTAKVLNIGCLVLGFTVYIIFGIFIAIEIAVKFHNSNSSESSNHTSHRVLYNRWGKPCSIYIHTCCNYAIILAWNSNAYMWWSSACTCGILNGAMWWYILCIHVWDVA